MRYGLHFSILFAGLFFVLWLILRRYPVWAKRWFRAGLLLFVALLVVISALIPQEIGTQAYSSPEEAFRYKNQGEILLVLEGEQSAYVVAKHNENSYSYDFIARDDDVWHPVARISTNPTVITQGSIVVCIYQYDETSDYYISITDGKGQEIEIADNRHSHFCKIGDSYEVSDRTFSMYTYYAYIDGLDAAYQLTVNGEVISLAS